MSDRVPPLERLSLAIATPTYGVLGVVDELLSVALDRDLRLAWESGRCQLQLGGEAARRVELPVGKSVVRAVLARIAALGNERRPGSVSPYGGDVEIAVDSGLVRATFVNTPGELSLGLASTRSEVAMVADSRLGR